MSDKPYDGGSALWAGPLGVVIIEFKGYNLGKTTAETTLEVDQDILDVKYQQDGSKAADHVRTGQDLVLTATFGEPSTGLLTTLIAGITSAEGVNDSGTIGRCLYQSMRETEGGALRIYAVDCNGKAVTDLEDILNGYEAIPITNGPIANWVSDAQRGLPVKFMIKYKEFDTPVVAEKPGAFMYWGDPVIEQVPAIVWPDVSAPQLLTASVVDLVSLDVVFDENIAFQGGSFPAGSVSANVDGAQVLATSAVIATDTMTVTFPAATFAAGNEVEITITGACLEDTETVANLYGGVDGQAVTNPLV